MYAKWMNEPRNLQNWGQHGRGGGKEDVIKADKKSNAEEGLAMRR